MREDGRYRIIDGCNLDRFEGRRVRSTIEEVPEAPAESEASNGDILFCRECKHFERPIWDIGCESCFLKHPHPNWEPKDAPEAPKAERDCETCKYSNSECEACICWDGYPFWRPKVAVPKGLPVTYKDGNLIMGDHAIAIDKIAQTVKELERKAAAPLAPRDGDPEPSGKRCDICHEVFAWSKKHGAYKCPSDLFGTTLYRPGEEGSQ